MYNNINLLDTPGIQKNKFSIAVLNKLFSSTELKTGIISEIKNKRNKSLRTILDPAKCLILKESVEIKFRISDDSKEQNWLEVKAICNRACYDCK